MNAQPQFQQDSIDSLVYGLSTKDHEKRILVMLNAYVDETGTGSKDGIFAMAGFVSTVSRWKEFADRWESAIDEFPATRGYFHASYAYSADEAWDETGKLLDQDERAARRDKKFNELRDIALEHTMANFMSVVNMKDYYAIYDGNVPDRYNNPYLALFWNIQIELAAWMHKEGRVEKVQFIFDDGVRDGPAAKAWHPELIACAPIGMSEILAMSPIFGNDKVIKPLQAADLYAWHIHRDLHELTDPKSKGLTPWQANAMHGFASAIGFEAPLGPEKLRKLVEVLNLPMY